MISKRLHIAAILAALVAMVLAILALTHSYVAQGAEQTQRRPNSVVVKTPSHIYGFRCGRVQNPARFQYVADNCRRHF